MVLGQCRSGSEVVIRSTTAAGAWQLRLAELGFVPGARIRVVRKGSGGLMIAIGDARIAIDTGIAGALVVDSAPVGPR